jgi:type II secretory pathway pseudopilin PulG
MTRRAAFTLVELLVVAGIFAMLFGMVLTGANPGRSSQIRQAAQSLASVLLATQSKALGNPVGAAVILESGTVITMSVSAANATMLPFIVGTTNTTDMPPSTLSSGTATVTITPTNANAAELVNGYKIQFLKKTAATQAPSAWLKFSCSTVTGTCTVEFRTANGQTLDNTIWPKALGTGAFDVNVARYPAKAEAAYAFSKAAAIDLRYSGVGDGNLYNASWSDLSNKGDIGLVYDSIGGIDAVMQRVLSPGTIQPIDPASPIYLLVAARSDVIANTSLRSDRSLWVVIHQQTGRVSISSNIAQSGTNATALRAARANARAQIAIGK